MKWLRFFWICIDGTTKRNIQMEIFAHVLLFQANLPLHLSSRLTSWSCLTLIINMGSTIPGGGGMNQSTWELVYTFHLDLPFLSQVSLLASWGWGWGGGYELSRNVYFHKFVPFEESIKSLSSSEIWHDDLLAMENTLLRMSCYYLWLLYSAILHSREDSLRSSHMGFWMSGCGFLWRILNIHWSGVLTALFGCCMAGATWNCCCLSASSVYTLQPCTTLQCHFIQNHMHIYVFSCNLPSALLAEWPGSFVCYCSDTGVDWIP